MIHKASVLIYGSTDEAVVNTLNICFPALGQSFSPLTSAENGFFREEVLKNTVPSDYERDDIDYQPPTRKLHINCDNYDDDEDDDNDDYDDEKEKKQVENTKVDKESPFSWDFEIMKEEFLVGSYYVGKPKRDSDDEEQPKHGEDEDGSTNGPSQRHVRTFVSYKTPGALTSCQSPMRASSKKRIEQKPTLTEKEYKTCYKHLQSLTCNVVAIKQNPTHFDCNVGDRRKYNENASVSVGPKSKSEYVDEYYVKFSHLEEEFGPACSIIYAMDLGLPFNYLLERQITTPGEFYHHTQDYVEYDAMYANEKQTRIDKIEREYTRYLLKEKNKILNLFTLDCTRNRPRIFVFYLPPQVEKFELPSDYYDDLGVDENYEKDPEYDKMIYALQICFQIITHVFVLCGLENVQQLNGRQKICLMGKIFSDKTEEDMESLNRAIGDLKRAHAKISSSASFHLGLSDVVHVEAFASTIIQTVYEFYNDDVKKENRFLDNILIQNKNITM